MAHQASVSGAAAVRHAAVFGGQGGTERPRQEGWWGGGAQMGSPVHAPAQPSRRVHGDGEARVGRRSGGEQ